MACSYLMRMCRLSVPLFLTALFVVIAFGADVPTPILPKEFGGWQMSGDAKTSNDPGMADASNRDLLKEYGFADFASASYRRDDGRKLALKAARFADATGAYGAFTY